MCTGPRQPSGDCTFAVLKHSHGCSDTQPFSHCRQDFCDSRGWRLESIEWGIAPGSAGGSTSLAAKGLNPLVLAMRAVADQGMELRVGDAIVRARLVGTGEAIRRDAFRCASSALQFPPRANGWKRWSSGWSQRSLAALGTIRWRARFEQALTGPVAEDLSC